eukprot:748391-Hanusia_phi.AAC.2
MRPFGDIKYVGFFPAEIPDIISQHQDAHEFMNYLLNQITEELHTYNLALFPDLHYHCMPFSPSSWMQLVGAHSQRQGGEGAGTSPLRGPVESRWMLLVLNSRERSPEVPKTWVQVMRGVPVRGEGTKSGGS